MSSTDTAERADSSPAWMINYLPVILWQRRYYVLICFLAAYNFAQPLFEFLVEPLRLVQEGQPGVHRLIFTAPTGLSRPPRMAAVRTCSAITPRSRRRASAPSPKARRWSSRW